MKQLHKNGKITQMSKIINYFYIFSKITTSLVLLLFVFFLAYALLVSYRDVDFVSKKIETKYNLLSELNNINNVTILDLKKQISKSNKEIISLKNTLQKKDKNLIEDDYKNKIEELSKINLKLQKEIKDIGNLLNTNSYSKNNLNIDNENTKKINNLVKRINLKFDNGDIVGEDILLLSTLFKGKNSQIFEKLFLIESKKFYGLKQLRNNFDIAITKYSKYLFFRKKR